MSLFRRGKANKPPTTLNPEEKQIPAWLAEIDAYLERRREYLFQEEFNVDNMENHYKPGDSVVWGAKNELMGRQEEVRLLGEFVASQMVQAFPDETAA